MLNREITATERSGRPLWWRLVFLTFVGVCLLTAVAILGFASSEPQQESSTAWQWAAVVLVLVGVAARAFVLVRRSGAAVSRSFLVAGAVGSATIAAPGGLLWLFVEAFSW
jgi:hypothetical protein